MSPKEQYEQLIRGTAKVLSEKELLTKLEKGQPLRAKLGVDPTAPDIHLGHTVVLEKLRQFQSLGHQAVLIIGDFTATVGDPTGRSSTRPPLSRDEVLANAETYTDQAFKILDKDQTEVVYNGEWFRKMNYEEVLKLNARVTMQQMLQREDFKSRIDDAVEVRLHEIQYPIMQGWDSVEVRADVELGGTDQRFNLLMGRELQKEQGITQQSIVMVPLLEGLDGVQKMSKSLNNYIGITDAPNEMFGKVMSISDDLMWRYYDLLSFRPLEEIAELKTRVEQGENPRDIKILLAKEIIARFHDEAAAEGAHQDFIQRFQKNAIPDDMPEIEIALGDEGIAIGNLLKEAKLVGSTSDAMRMIKQGAVKINGDKVEDTRLVIAEKGENVYQVGKRKFARITLA